MTSTENTNPASTTENNADEEPSVAQETENVVNNVSTDNIRNSARFNIYEEYYSRLEIELKRVEDEFSSVVPQLRQLVAVYNDRKHKMDKITKEVTKELGIHVSRRMFEICARSTRKAWIIANHYGFEGALDCDVHGDDCVFNTNSRMVNQFESVAKYLLQVNGEDAIVCCYSCFENMPKSVTNAGDYVFDRLEERMRQEGEHTVFINPDIYEPHLAKLMRDWASSEPINRPQYPSNMEEHYLW